jgi:hypothetical protein
MGQDTKAPSHNAMDRSNGPIACGYNLAIVRALDPSFALNFAVILAL